MLPYRADPSLASSSVRVRREQPRPKGTLTRALTAALASSLFCRYPTCAWERRCWRLANWHSETGGRSFSRWISAQSVGSVGRSLPKDSVSQSAALRQRTRPSDGEDSGQRPARAPACSLLLGIVEVQAHSVAQRCTVCGYDMISTLGLRFTLLGSLCTTSVAVHKCLILEAALVKRGPRVYKRQHRFHGCK